MLLRFKNLLASISHAWAGISLAETGELPVALPTTIPPYLQRPAPDGMTICFAARHIQNVQIAWNRDGDPAQQEKMATPVAVPKTPWTIWKTRLTELQSGTVYHYRLRYWINGREQQERQYSFRTLDSDASTVQVVLFNDLHNNDEMLELLLRRIHPDDYEFSVLLGDCWEDPSLVDGARETFATLNAYIRLLNASEKPMLFVRGNHEVRGDFASRIGLIFDLPNLDATTHMADQNYPFSFQAGPVWFLAMDCGADFNKQMELYQPYRKRQLAWLEQELAAKGNDANSWRVLISHIPLYNNNDWNSEPARLMWEATLSNARLDLALAGHDHEWKHLAKDQPLQHVGEEKGSDGRPFKKTWTVTPPYPVLIGGGPAPGKGTVMLLQATRQKIQTKLLGTDHDRCLAEIKLEKPIR